MNRANLQIYQGDDYSAVVRVSDGTPGGPNLAGYTSKAQIRTGPADSSPAVTVEIATAITPGQPEVTLLIPHTNTVTLSGNYSWDLELIDPLGTVTTILAGICIVTPEITR